VTPAALNLLNAALFSVRMEQPDGSPLRELTAGLARGDDAAWAQFHRDYGPGIFRQLLAATRGDYDLASESLQQTYLRIARHARPCESAAMFGSWLRTVTRSALSDCRRRRRSFWMLLSRRQSDPSDEADYASNEDRLLVALESALAAIGPDARRLLESKYLLGSDVRMLALHLAISEKAVESRLTRARAELRERLLANLPDHEQ
jgi:RNA polymerase sigma factor (sigma-70 family)